MGPLYPLAAPGVDQIAFGIEFQHRRLGAVEGIDIAFMIDGDVGHLSPFNVFRQRLGPVRIHDVFGRAGEWRQRKQEQQGRQPAVAREMNCHRQVPVQFLGRKTSSLHRLQRSRRTNSVGEIRLRFLASAGSHTQFRRRVSAGVTYKQLNAIHKDTNMSAIRMTSLALAGTLALSSAALAQDSQTEDNQERQDRAAERLARIDTNGDGAVSIDEYLAGTAGDRIDVDGDGLITLEEYVANFDRVRGDGRLAGARAGASREQIRARVEQRLSERFAGIDGDDDGVVTLAEYRAEMFENLDRNDDGLLQPRELRGLRGGPGGPGRGDRPAGAQTDTDQGN
ncbi:MAG: hypothetical protein F4161_12565 [Gammaproteobacteria bacterium]|nr:hypothetical protein [Gammaproteobacteria bacterium]